MREICSESGLELGGRRFESGEIEKLKGTV